MRINRRQFCARTFQSYSALTLSSILPAFGCAEVAKALEPDLLTTLAFGSCNKQNMVTTHWPIINAKRPQGWLWMGDAIYADGLAPRSRAVEYGKVLGDKGYQDLLAQSFVMGTWDDHDYSANDGGIEYEEKIGSQESFLNFIDEPLDSPRRLQAGIYSSRLVGKETNQIQFILLDLRYFKTKESASSPDTLGAAQWAWLENEIKKPGPAHKVLVSSIQVLTDFTGKDTWACYPEAQTRLLGLIRNSPVPVSILSGDRHLHEISKRDLSQDRIVHEITSSGLTHFTESTNDNPFRIDYQITESNFGILTFDWDTSEAPRLKGIKSSVYSPQSGDLLRDFAIPVKWL